MAAFIPQEIIDEVMAKTDIVELVSSYIPLTRRGRNHVALCPFHNEDTPSFSVNQDKQIFYCFGCQKGGNAISFVMEMEALPFPEAVRKLAERVGVTVPEQISPQARAASDERQSMLRLSGLAADFFMNRLLSGANAAAAYLKQRGIGAETVRAFKLGYSPEEDWQALYAHLSKQGYSGPLMEKAGLVGQSSSGRYYDKFHGRLIFPIADYRGQTVAFGGRILGEGQPKYLNSPQTPVYNKSAHLYGLSQAIPAIRQANLAVIMEGYIDVLTAHQQGLSNAVASLGTAFTVEQARLLRRYTERVLLAYDGDSAGAKAALRGLDILREAGLAVRVLVLPPGQDPDDFLKAEGLSGWERLVEEQAHDVLDYLLKRALSLHDAGSAAGKGAIVRELLPAIAKTASAVERESFIAKLADRLAVSPATVYADLRKSGLKLTQPRQLEAAAPALAGPLAAKSADIHRQLMRYAVENKALYQCAKEELGEDFAAGAADAQLIELIDSLGENYDFQPASLINHIPLENEGLRQYLLKLLQINVSEEQAATWGGELLTPIRMLVLEKKIAEAKAMALQAADKEERDSWLKRQFVLLQRLHQLKG